MTKVPDGWMFIPKMKDAVTINVEMRELVLCRNCKYGEPCDKDIYCTKDIGTIESSVHKPDWFCADGKRKEGRRSGIRKAVEATYPFKLGGDTMNY